MSLSVATAPATEGRLAHYPITFFAIVMGFLGLALALHAASKALGVPVIVVHLAVYASAALMVLVAAGYALKAVVHPRMAAADWHHPVRLAFFPTISISMLLLAVATLSEHPGVAEPLWIAGTGLQGVLSLLVISTWIGHREFQHVHLSAAWFIPPVGNVLVPVAGAQLGYTSVSWLFFSGGLLFWIVLLTLVVNRLTFHAPLPSRLQPTLVILIAPPAVGFIAWVKLNGSLDAFALFLLNAAYVLALVVGTQIPRILRLPFALSFWALSFPLAALTVATFLYAGEVGSVAHRHLGAGLLVLLLGLIAALVARTVMAIGRHELCRPE